MSHTTQWLLLMAPFAVFIAVFAGAFFIIYGFARTLKANITNTVRGKEVHIRSPLGTLDVEPETTLDPRLASILMYPGAAPLEPGVADYHADLHVLHREFKAVTAQYWTSAPEQIVREFYQRELPGWQIKQGTLTQTTTDGAVQAIGIRASGERTIIEIAVRDHTADNEASVTNPSATLH